MNSHIDEVTGLIPMPLGAGENSQDQPLPMASLLSLVFERFDRQGIKWVVLRNAGTLPEFTGYDIDLLILSEDKDTVTGILLESVIEMGWELLGRMNKRHYCCLLLYYSNGIEQYLPIDIFTGLEYRGLPFGEISTLFAHRVRSTKGVWKLRPGHEAAITMLKELLPHSVLKEKQLRRIKKGTLEDSSGFKEFLDLMLGSGLSQKLLEYVHDGNNKDSGALTREIRKRLKKKYPGYWFRFLNMIWKNICLLWAPSVSSYVALIGPDGCGKTTIAFELAQRLYKRPYKACRYMRGNFEIVPRIREIRTRLFKKVRKKKSTINNKLIGMMKPLPMWKSMLISAYYALDMFLGRVKLCRWRMQWNLIVFDRSFYDYYFQLGHNNLPAWYLDLLSFLVPKPDVMIYLKRDAQQIYDKKPELTVEEIEREQKIIEQLVEKKKFAKMINAEVGIDNTAKAACHCVKHELHGRSFL